MFKPDSFFIVSNALETLLPSLSVCHLQLPCQESVHLIGLLLLPLAQDWQQHVPLCRWKKTPLVCGELMFAEKRGRLLETTGDLRSQGETASPEASLQLGKPGLC